jgi:flavin-dependent dehydrogenase
MEPIIKNGFVTGVLAKNVGTSNEFAVHAQVVVDASGILAILRKKLPPEIGVEANVNPEDFVICYREIRKLKEDTRVSNFCELYFNQTLYPGGYAWIFSESGTKVNAGCGVSMSQGFPNPKSQFYHHVLSDPRFEEDPILRKGGGYVPTRRPINSMVGNGIIIVGDAACQVNPIHGGGIGPSMKGGTIAGETITQALDSGEVSRDALWQYNVRYMQSYGAKQAGLDVFRLLLQKLRNQDLNYGLKHHLITKEDLLKTSMGEDLRLNITEKTRRVFKGIGKLPLLRKLVAAAKLMNKLKTLYKNYPTSPKRFREWTEKTRRLIEAAEKL